MSGCVDCVWERFREEMDEWAMANAEAQRRAKLDREAGETVGDQGLERNVEGVPVGGLARTKKAKAAGATATAPVLDEDVLYHDVPIGIREFMKHEKRLKEQRERNNHKNEAGKP